MLRCVPTCNNCSHSRAAIDALADVCVEVSMGILAEALRIDVMIVWLSGEMIALLAWGMVDFGVDMLAEVRMIVVIVAIIVSEVPVPVSCATDVRAGAMIDDVLTGTAISVVPASDIDVLAGVDPNMWAPMTTVLA